MSVGWLDEFVRNLRYGSRAMWRAPGFTALAIAALALGIGANTAIFTVVNAVLLRPLPYKDPGRLVTVLHNGTGPVSVANYVDWRDQSSSFDEMAAADYWTPNLTGIDPPEHLWGLLVTQNLFPMLGVEPLLGRWFVPGEDRKGAEHEVILSYRLWQRRFAGDPHILGKPLTLDGEVYTIVGVMPAFFQFAPFWATRAELWAPNAFGERVHDRNANSLRVFARLKAGVALAQARAEIAGITARLERQYPGTNRHIAVTPLKENVVGKIEAPLMLLVAAVAFVLLIACANVAHMLLARAAVRQREVAVRAALGAGRARLLRQFLSESVLLAAAGAAAGLLLALWATRTLAAVAPAAIPRIETVGIDFRVVLFLLGVTLLTGVGFGLLPALRASALELATALKEGGRGSSEGFSRNRLRAALVASEVALSLMLLIGAGLMVRSFFALQSIDPGFHPRNVLSMIVSVAGSRQAAPERRAVFYRHLLERVRRLPGVVDAAGINHLPLAGDTWILPFTIAGRPKPGPGESPNAVYRLVTPGYFRTMRLPLLRGRDITEADARAPGVVIVNERAARQYWPDEDPVGKRITFDDRQRNSPAWLTVIGVARDARQDDWAADPLPEVYLAAFQNAGFLGNAGSHSAYITLVVRTAGRPEALASAVRNVVWSLDRNLPISEVLTMEDVVAAANARPRFEMLLLAVFAAIALVLAAVGIYGVMSYAVSRRTHEIGIRISLGATPGDVLRLVVRQGMTVALVGSGAGLAGALLLSRLMTGLLYGVRPTDPLTFAAVALVLMLVALLATWVPARRATRIDPVAAFRE